MSDTSSVSATAGLLPVGAPTVAAGSTVLTVGVGKEYSTVSAAIAASHDGDTVLVDAGTYTNDFATISTKITIEGVGGMVNMVATVPPTNLKGILTVDNDVTIENMSFSGSAVPDSDGGNGAGIRYEGGQMVLVNDSFTGNQDGILGSAVIPALTVNTITVDHSVFNGNGSGSGNTHNLYVGDIQKLTATDSVFENAVVGHEFKSRAQVNDIENNVFSDGPTGTASYSIDLPDGGVDLVKNNVIEKGPNAENNAIVHFGGEGIPYAGSTLLVTGNTFVNDRGQSAVAVLNQTAISVTINNNDFTGLPLGQVVQGPATGTGNVDNLGETLPSLAQTGVLPGNTTVFTDNLAHTIVLGDSNEAVEGGGGLLTVSDLAGHVVAIGGAGGMNFTEAPGVGGNSVTTAAGSVNQIIVSGQDLIDSEGTDTIMVGAGNIAALVNGTANIAAGTGSDQWSVNGSATLAGQGGVDAVRLGAAASLIATGSMSYLDVQTNGGSAILNVLQNGTLDVASISSGAGEIRLDDTGINVFTALGTQGATVRLGTGKAQVTSLGSDAIYAGSGADTVIVSGKAKVYAGTGTLSLYNHGQSGATLYGNGGDYVIDGDTGSITYYGGLRDSTVEDRLANDTLIGGLGHLTINGGSRETITGGSGGISLAEGNGGANVITTVIGAIDSLELTGSDTVVSRGRDTISGGSGNQSMTIYGNSQISGSTGNSQLSFFGNDTLVGKGYDQVTVNPGAQVAITAGTLTTVTETAATVLYSVNAGPDVVSLSVTAGSASITGGTTTATTVITNQGHSTTLALSLGAISANLNGSDTVRAGAGADFININAANVSVTGGSGALTVHNNTLSTSNVATIHGGSGTLSYQQGGAALRFIGGAGSAVIDGGWGSLTVIGGAGNITLTNGSAGLIFAAGSGNANIDMTASGGTVALGTGNTTVDLAGYGQAAIFHAVAGRGGGTDVITGFRSGTDQFILQGVSVASETFSGGSTLVTLNDHTLIQFVGTSGAISISSSTPTRVGS